MTKLWIEVIALGFIFWLEGLFPLFQDRTQRFRHAGRNLSMGAINGLLVGFLFSGITLQVIRMGQAKQWGILYVLGDSGWERGFVAILLFDLWMYLWHRANHRIPFLWRFHRTHHSDTEMDCTSALRFHFGEIAFSSVLRLLVIPLIGISYSELLIYEIILQPVIIFHHSNVSLPEKIDRIGRAVIVTPNMHRVHHSQIQTETDSNYSSIFSWWDRFAGTFKRRENTRAIVYGLAYLRELQWQSLAGMLRTPFTRFTKQQNQGEV